MFNEFIFKRASEGKIRSLICEEKTTLKRFFRIFFIHDLSELTINKGMLYTASNNGRADYTDIISSVEKKISCNHVDLSHDSLKLSFRFVTSVKVYLGILRIVKKANLNSIMKRVDLFCYIVYLYRSILTLTNGIKVNKYLAFMPNYGLEYLISLKLKEDNPSCNVYMLQHANFIYSPMLSVFDRSIYDLFNSEYMLCWGKNTIDSLKVVIDKDKLLLAGYPIGGNTHLVKDIQFNIETSNKVLILLAGIRYINGNIELLKEMLLLDNDFSYYVKLHPSDNEGNYTSINNISRVSFISKMTLSKAIDRINPSFCISVNTTAFYDSFINGVYCFNYKCLNSHVYPNVCSHDTIISGTVNDKFRALKNKKIIVRKKDIENKIGLNVDNYRNILCLK